MVEKEEKQLPLLLETLETTPRHYFAPHTNKTKELQVECLVCKKPSKYVCPKCSQYYCTISCYKQHGESCTEKFYQEQCEQHMKGKKVEQKSANDFKKKMAEEMRNLPEPCDELNNIKTERLEILLQKVEEEELDIDDLTQEEKRDFYQFLEGHKVQEQQFCWRVTEDLPSLFVQDFEYQQEQDQQEEDFQEDEQQDQQDYQDISRKKEKLIKKRLHLVQQFQKLPQINIINKLTPTSEVTYHIVNTVYVFCAISRFFNNDFHNNLHESYLLFEQNCQVLRQQKTQDFGSVANILTQSESWLHKELELFKPLLLEDISLVYNELFLVVECLFKVYDLYHAYEEIVQDGLLKALEKQGEENKTKQIKKIHFVKQKIMFYLAFLKKFRTDTVNFVKIGIEKYVQGKERFEQATEKLGKAKKLHLLL